MRLSLLWASQLLLIATLHAPAKASDLSLSLLPTSNSVQARVMQIGLPIEAQRTAMKLKAALSDQPEWAKTFIAENDRPGRPLPYHQNLRVTEDEYRTFLAAAAKPSLVQVGSVSLSAERQQDGSIRLSTLPTTSRINGITIYPGGKSVTTELATLVDLSAVNNQSAEGATGRWTGTQWRHESTSLGHLLAVKFAIGRRTDHGDGIIYYDVKNVRGEKSDVYYEVLLFPVSK